MPIGLLAVDSNDLLYETVVWHLRILPVSPARFGWRPPPCPRPCPAPTSPSRLGPLYSTPGRYRGVTLIVGAPHQSVPSSRKEADEFSATPAPPVAFGMPCAQLGMRLLRRVAVFTSLVLTVRAGFLPTSL